MSVPLPPSPLHLPQICKAPETEGAEAPGVLEAPEAEEAPMIETPINASPTGNLSAIPFFEALAPEVCTMACNTTFKVEFPTPTHEKAAHVLHYLSLAILVFFAVETTLLIIALGHLVFKRWVVLLDGVVIAASIVVDVALHDAAGAIIIVVRLWRVARIAHGIFETIYDRLNDKIVRLKSGPTFRFPALTPSVRRKSWRKGCKRSVRKPRS